MIVISDPHYISDEANVMNALFDAGLSTLHLRKPESPIEQMCDLISQIETRYHNRIMIHSHFELLKRFELKGIHFTQKLKHLQKEYHQVRCTKSLPVHDLEELEGVSDSIDYVLLSPIFSSVSKIGYSKEWDFNEIETTLSRQRTFKVVALGGITCEKAELVKSMGFDDYALLGSIWEPLKSGASVADVLTIFRSYK